MIELTYNKQDLADLLGTLATLPKGLSLATSRAINKTLVSARAEMVRLIRRDYVIKAGDIRKELVIVRSTQLTMEGRVGGESSPGVPLLQFARIRQVPSTRRTKSGAYTPKVGIPVLIRKDRGKRVAKGVFLARMGSGHVGAFMRTEQTFGRVKRASKMGKRYIKEVYGPTPIKLLAAKQYQEPIESFVSDTMDKNLKHEADFILSQAGLQ